MAMRRFGRELRNPTPPPPEWGEGWEFGEPPSPLDVSITERTKRISYAVAVGLVEFRKHPATGFWYWRPKTERWWEEAGERLASLRGES